MKNVGVEMERVEKRFGSIVAADRISLAIPPCSIVALLGPNGAGKTTALRMIVGILRPDAGRIEFAIDGVRGTGLPTRMAGYLPEERGLYPDIEVLRMLIYFGRLRGMARSDAKRAAHAWLDRLELAGRADAPLKSLSKGNQQKVQFASSVLHRPALAILDEPFSGLDPLNQNLFLELIREMRADGSTVLVSAHQLQLVERLADHVFVLRDGRIVLDEPIQAIRGRRSVEQRITLRIGGGDVDGFVAAVAPAKLERRTDHELVVTLPGEVELRHILAEAAQRLDIKDLQVERPSLHDVYVHAVSAGAGENE
jgi:ABC-2 type transport system ATP-binding protein